MINRRILLTFLLMLTIIGLTSCSDDDELSQITEANDDLVAAIRQGDVSLVTEIIEDNSEDLVDDILNTRIPPAGPDPGLTPLMIAARDIDNPELVKLLINNGADASLTTDPQGWTALLYALAFNKSVGVATEVLKAHNPNKDQKLGVAYKPSTADLLRVTPLSSEKDPGYLPAGATALILSTFLSDGKQALSRVQLLPKFSVDLEVGDKNGRKAALYAAVHHDAEVLNALLGAGADVTGLKDASGNTVLAHVVENGVDVNVVDALVGAGVSVDEENKDGYTGLQWAAQKGGTKSADFISKLLELKADVNKANTQQEGRTALIFAVQSDNVAAVKVLVNAAGIELEKADATGKTASAYATGNAEILALIVGDSPTLTIAPATLSFTATETAAKTATITLSNAATWTVGTPTYTDGAGWLTVAKGTGDDANTLTVTVSAHTGTTDRTGSVELTPAGGTAVSLSVTQTSPPSLSVAPTSLAFTTTVAGTETATITLSNAATWTVGTPSETWITATKSENTLTVAVKVNAATALRTGTVALTPAGGTAVSLSVTQAGTAPGLSVDPTPLSLTSVAGYKTVAVTLYSADSWAVGTPSDSWITVAKGTGDAANTLKVTVSAHTGATDRSGTVALTPTASGTSTDGTAVTLTVTQTPPPTLTLSPVSPLTFTATATATDAQEVTITLVNADSWAVGTPSDSWITATKGTGTKVNTLTVSVSAHTGAASRTGNIALTPAQDGTDGTAVSLTVTQTGTAPTLTLSPVSPLTFTATGADQTVTISLVNANTWTVGTPSGTWLTVEKGTGDDVNTLTVSVDAHTGDALRTGTVALTPAQDGTDGTAISLTVNQSSPPTLTLSPVSPLNFAVAGSTERVTITLTNANTWTVGTPSGTWITATKGTGADVNVLTVIVGANTGVERTGSVALTPAGGAAVSLTVTQAGTPLPSLSVPAASLALSFTATGVAQSVAITLDNGATSWTSVLSYTDGSGWLTASAETATPNVLDVSVTSNEGATADVRSATITLTPTLGSALGTPVVLTVTQAPPSPTLTLSPVSPLTFTATDASGLQTVTVTVVNGDTWSLGAVSGNTDAWITLAKSATDDAVLNVTVNSANTGVKRTVTVELTPTRTVAGGENVDGLPIVLTIDQADGS